MIELIEVWGPNPAIQRENTGKNVIIERKRQTTNFNSFSSIPALRCCRFLGLFHHLNVKSILMALFLQIPKLLLIQTHIFLIYYVLTRAHTLTMEIMSGHISVYARGLFSLFHLSLQFFPPAASWFRCYVWLCPPEAATSLKICARAVRVFVVFVFRRCRVCVCVYLFAIRLGHSFVSVHYKVL